MRTLPATQQQQVKPGHFTLHCVGLGVPSVQHCWHLWNEKSQTLIMKTMFHQFMSHLARPNWIADGVHLILPLVPLHTTKLDPLSKMWMIARRLDCVSGLFQTSSDDFSPWNNIWRQQDSPTPTRRAFYPSSHPTQLLSDKWQKWWNNWTIESKNWSSLKQTQDLPCPC